jgi:two-component system response regulator AtoC
MPHSVVAPPPPHVLIVDDDASMAEFLAEGLAPYGYTTSIAAGADEALASIGGVGVASDGDGRAVDAERGGAGARDGARVGEIDVVVTDLNMPGTRGTELCRAIAARAPEIPVLLLTAFGSLETAIEAIRAGAYDFLTKPVEIEALQLAIARAAQHRSLEREVRRLRSALAVREGFEEMVGESAPMRRLYEVVARVADANASVLIHGESGTGKELVARAIHRRSARREKPFVAINCAALPEALLESELFGHVRGAFTDAKSARTGLLVQANGGTLFLDEIGDMPLGLQPKLLRVLQERRVRPIGASAEIPIDVRVLAATHRDLQAEVEAKRFREDLYFRIHVIEVSLPPLRARGADVLELAGHFLRAQATNGRPTSLALSSAAAEKLLAYSWPGNVRELANCIEHAAVLARGASIEVGDLPDRVKNHRASHVVVASENPNELLSMQEVERRYVLRVIEACGGNKATAARILGFDRTTLYRKLERWGVEG